jgi:hypothetical protein
MELKEQLIPYIDNTYLYNSLYEKHAACYPSVQWVFSLG